MKDNKAKISKQSTNTKTIRKKTTISKNSSKNNKSKVKDLDKLQSSKTRKPRKRKVVRKKSKKPVFQFKTKTVIYIVLTILLLFFSLIGGRYAYYYFKSSTYYFVRDHKKGDQIVKNYYKFGIDISHHNDNNIQWDSLRLMVDYQGYTTKTLSNAKQFYNIDFIIIKATEGVNFVDYRFSDNWKKSREHRYKTGAYHFYRTNQSPVKQAKHFINTVKELSDNDLPPILDIETKHRGMTKNKLNRDLKIWLDLVEKQWGKRPIIYTSNSYAKYYISKDILNHYPLWIARYNVYREPSFSKWKYWQFTDKAVVQGIRGYVDLSAIR